MMSRFRSSILVIIFLLRNVEQATISVAAADPTPPTDPPTSPAPAEVTDLTLPEDPFKVTSSGRLPTWISPSHYDLFLKVNLDNSTYDGVVNITVQVVNSTDKIVLNMVDIVTINESVKVTSLTDGRQELEIVNQSFESYLQFYVIQLSHPLPEGGRYEVLVPFRGTLNSKLVGFYLSTYKDAQGQEVRVASTQFSPTDARRAFPCFDEPGFKATFDIAIERDAGKAALSNMPLLSTSPVVGHEGRFVDRFERTLKMSTYLVGFLVSDFVNLSSDALNHTEFRVWSREEAINQTAFALKVGPQLLLYLEDYFGVTYPLPKLDMAAIPNFKFNGMENWGLIMYRESAMLFDPLLSTISDKRGILKVIAHEIAHMWFGNLVTPKWWSELWLKEGFANFMGYKAIDYVDPSWNMMNYLVFTSTHNAFAQDSLKSSHPINAKVDHPDRISEIFDSISYDKGASIIRMMNHFLTEEVYKQGMQSYVRNLEYENAVQSDLWHYLTEAWKGSGSFDPSMTVEDVMNTWTVQDGFPVVSVLTNGSQVLLRQERFLLQPTSSTGNDSTYTDRRWWIPISVATETSPTFNSTAPKIWMNPKDEVTILNDLAHGKEWFILNVQTTGFFRVNYDNITWDLLSKQLMKNHSVIHNLNRAQLLDDSLNLARAGLVNYSLPLHMGKYMKDERDLSAWTPFLDNYNYIYNLAKISSDITPFNNYLQDVIVPLYNLTGFSNDTDAPPETQSLSKLATHWACRIGYEPCVEKAKELFHMMLELPKEHTSRIIPKNVAPTVLCTGIKNATEAVWNKTFEAYLTSNVQTEKSYILTALGCTEDTKILKRYLDMTVDPTSPILKQDIAYVFRGVSVSRSGRDLAWETIKEKWRTLFDLMGPGSSVLWRIFSAPTATFSTKELVAELEAFLDRENDFLGSVRQTVQRSLEKAKLNQDWRQNYFPQVLSWMEASQAAEQSK